MAKLTRRRHREYLWLDFDFEIEHHANDVGAVHANAHRLNVGIVLADLVREFFERRAQFDVLDVDDQTLGLLDEEVRVLERERRFKSDARVFIGRPYPRTADLAGCPGGRRQQGREQKRQR